MTKANTAPIKWAQRSDSLYITIALPGELPRGLGSAGGSVSFIFFVIGGFAVIWPVGWGAGRVVLVGFSLPSDGSVAAARDPRLVHDDSFTSVSPHPRRTNSSPQT